jgi:hypothetical protein
MIGTVVTGSQLVDMEKAGTIRISGFRAENIQVIHYPLHPETFHLVGPRGADGEPTTELRHVRTGKHPDLLSFDSNGYMLVQIRELVVLPKGVIAQFATPMEMVKSGFDLNAGRAQAPFGQNNERLVFGVRNLLSVGNIIDCAKPVAYMYLFDVRGLRETGADVSSEFDRLFDQLSKERNKRRKAADSGPDYGDGDL